MPNRRDRPEDVRLELALYLPGGGPFKRSEQPITGVADQQVQCSKSFERRGNRARNARFVGDVEREGQNIWKSGEIGQGGDIARRRYYVKSPAGHDFRCVATDTA